MKSIDLLIQRHTLPKEVALVMVEAFLVAAEAGGGGGRNGWSLNILKQERKYENRN